jgi:hypothetical protein
MRQCLFLDLPTVMHGLCTDLVPVVLRLFGETFTVLLRL